MKLGTLNSGSPPAPITAAWSAPQCTAKAKCTGQQCRCRATRYSIERLGRPLRYLHGGAKGSGQVTPEGQRFGTDYWVARQCGARTRSGTPCRAPGLRNGRCRLHGGLSTGPRTQAGLNAMRRAKTMHGLYAGPGHPDFETPGPYWKGWAQGRWRRPKAMPGQRGVSNRWWEQDRDSRGRFMRRFMVIANLRGEDNGE
jgi:hypothetical protein